MDTLIKLAGSLDIPPGDLLEGLHWEAGYTEAGTYRLSADSGE